MIRRGAFLAAGAAVSIFPARVRAAGLTKVRIGATVTQDVLGMLWAVESGIFQRAGLDVDVEHSSTGAAVSEAVMSGAFDIGKSSIIPMLTAHSRGLPFVLEAPGGVYLGTDPNAALVVGKDSPLKTGSDFSGKPPRHVPAPRRLPLPDIGMSAWTHSGTAAGFAHGEISRTSRARASRCDCGRAHRRRHDGGTAGKQRRAGFGKIRILAHPYDSIASRFAVTLIFTSADYAAKNADTLARFRKALKEGVDYATTHRTPSVARRTPSSAAST